MYGVKELRDTTSQLPTLHIAAASTRSHRNWTAPILAFSSHDAKIKCRSHPWPIQNKTNILEPGWCQQTEQFFALVFASCCKFGDKCPNIRTNDSHPRKFIQTSTHGARLPGHQLKKRLWSKYFHHLSQGFGHNFGYWSVSTISIHIVKYVFFTNLPHCGRPVF